MHPPFFDPGPRAGRDTVFIRPARSIPRRSQPGVLGFVAAGHEPIAAHLHRPVEPPVTLASVARRPLPAPRPGLRERLGHWLIALGERLAHPADLA